MCSTRRAPSNIMLGPMASPHPKYSSPGITRTLKSATKDLTPAHAVIFCLLSLAACADNTPSIRPQLPGADVTGLSAFEAPTCGARIFVAMGLNHKFPQRENMRIPRGDLYLDGNLVDRVSKNPEVTVLDVPAGKTQLSWIPSGSTSRDRSETNQNDLTLNLVDKETAFVVLDWFDDTPVATGLSFSTPSITFRTEVVETNDKSAFAGKRIVFHQSLDTLCSQAVTATATMPPHAEPQPAASLSIATQHVTLSTPEPQKAPPPSAALPRATAPSAELQQVAPAPPEPQKVMAPGPETQTVTPSTPEPQKAPSPDAITQQGVPASPAPQVTAPAGAVPSKSVVQGAELPAVAPDTAEDSISSAQFYYIVDARNGAPAFAAPSTEGSALYTFRNGTKLNVIEVSTDKRWLKVVVPGGRTGFVSTSIVATGFRLPK